MPLMLGIGAIMLAAMIALSQLFVTIGGPMVPDLLAEMPTIFHYGPDGTRIPEFAPILGADNVVDDGQGGKLSEAEFSELFPTLAMYGLMVKIAGGIFVILLMLAGISYFFEEFNVVRQGTAYDIIAKMIVLLPLYLVLPYLWDVAALVIESSSLYLMDPFGGDPRGRTTEMWCLMGSVTCSIDGYMTVDPIEVFDEVGAFDQQETLSMDSWNSALQDPFFGEGFVVDVLLSLFKGFAIMFMTAMMFILSAIRVLLTEIIIVSFPLVTAIGLIPWINTSKISDMFRENLIGLAMAPIISALVLSVGMSTIDSQNLPPLRMWFQLLGVGFLAVFFPVMLAPMLANLSGKISTMVSTAITSASMAGSIGLRGMARGIQGSGVAGAAGAAFGGTGSVGGIPRVASADIGTATGGTGAALGAISGMGSGIMPGLMPGMIPGLAPGMMPGMMPGLMSGIIPGLPPIAGMPTAQDSAESGEQDQTEDNTMMEPGTSLNMLHGEGS